MCEITWSPALPASLAGRLLVVLADPTSLEELSERFGAEVGLALKAAGFKGSSKQEFSFSTSTAGFCQVLLLGSDESSPIELRALSYQAGRHARKSGIEELVLDLRAIGAVNQEHARLVSEGLLLSDYSYDTYLTRADREDAKPELREVTIVGEIERNDARAGTQRGAIVADALRLARDLGNGPAELVTPTYLAEQAIELSRTLSAEGHAVSCEVLDADECKERGMGLYLAVARGSTEAPKFIHLSYRPKGGAAKKVCLIGKGVTFDSGGYSLKPTEGMLSMKLDMAGAAAVIGAFQGLVRLEVEHEIHVICAAAENMVSGSAYRLGDVFRASNGKTVEINNTDAEGRLTLADALVYATALEPDLIIDFATLTGACVVALGPHICGMMTRDDALAEAWSGAGARAGEDMWRLPLPKPLLAMLDSKVADLRNTGERAGGALTAGLFLEQFTADTRWMHVDIAGPAIVDKPFGVNSEGSSGIPVATMLEFLSAELPQ